MDEDRWRRIETLCHEAATRHPSARTAFLDEACGDDEALRREVESLLAGETRAQGFLAEPVCSAPLSPEAQPDGMLDKVLGHYRIVAKLGEGGMGVVYRARDERLQRDVAIKVLAAGILADQAGRDRFRTEALSLSRVNHPNIETIYDFDTQEGRDFLVLEYLPGQLLTDRLAAGPMAEADVVHLGREIAEALAAAHEAGVIHRDLKPRNVITQPDGRLKVLDFGIAKLRAPVPGMPVTTTTTGVVTGTLMYMAPEQLRGDRVDERTDLYALGVVLYEMATGERPYRETTAVGLADAILHAECQAPSRIRPGVSPWLEGVILKCLARDPADRYQTAAELVADLRQHVGPPRTVRARQSRRARVALASGAAVVALAITVLALDVAGVRERWFGAGATHPRNSIAVLPFENLSGSPEQEYFGAGVAEDINSYLTRIQGLKVIARTSTEQYRDTTKRLETVAEELGVDTMLTGSVRRAGGRVRISVQLVDARNGEVLWGDTYDRDLADIFAVQSEVAREVAATLEANLLGDNAVPSAEAVTANLDAYDHYQRGISYYNPSASERQIRLSIQQFEEAVRLDPSFAQAWAKLAEAHACMWWFTYDRSAERSGLARDAVDHAIALDADLPDAHRALGFYHYWVEQDYERAVEEFELARKGRPSDSWATLGIGWIRRRQGRFEESLRYQLLGLELDPRNANTAYNLAQSYSYVRRPAEDNQYLERALAIDPMTTAAYAGLIGDNLLLTGDVGLARRWFEQAVSAGFAQDPFVIEYGVSLEIAARDYQVGIQRLSAAPGDAFNRHRSYRPKALVEGELRALLGDLDAARRAYAAARSLLEQKLHENPGDARYHASLGLALAGLGLKGEAIREGLHATELSPVGADAFLGPLRIEDLARIYAMVGEPDLALDQLEYLMSIPADFGAGALRLDPVWDPLRANPRFQRLLERASMQQ